MRYAPFHQHFFCARLESSVDGMNNTVFEVNTRGVEGAVNPHHSAYTIEQTLLRRESEVQRTVNASESRFWRIINKKTVALKYLKLYKNIQDLRKLS